MGAAFAQFEGNVPKMAAQRRFKGYGPGKRRRDEMADVLEDHVLEQLKTLWREYKPTEWHDNDYKHILERLCSVGIGYSSEDVERFSIILPDFQHEKCFGTKAGIFLSALINKGKDNEYTVHTHPDIWIHFLGYKNMKTINVEGDLGNDIGAEMDNGKIHVKGSIQYGVGEAMSGGKIVIDGDVKGWVGEVMQAGKIHVKGSVGESVGARMVCGEIVIDGNAGFNVGQGMVDGKIYLGGEYDLAPYFSWFGKLWAKLKRDYLTLDREIKGGKIHHKGVLIVDK